LDLFGVAATEKAEKSIDAFIEKRARERADANKVEELWVESSRRVRERRREETLDALFGPAKEADPEMVLKYASASEEALSIALEMAVTSDNLETVQLVVLAVYQRDLTNLLSRFGAMVSESDDLIAELFQIDNVPDEDAAGDRFATLAPDPPTRDKILTA
jgi:hypothetical protein